MSKFRNKAASAVLSVTTAVWLSGATMLVPVAHGQTAADLQAQIQSLLSTIAALQAQLSALSGGTVTTACNFTRDLTVGATGDDVKCLQQYLNGTSYKVAASGAGSPGNETTYFGPRTQAAVAAWQAGNGVSPAAGYFGPISRAKYTALAGTGTGGGGGVVVPSTGLAVSKASDTPASASVPLGAANVPFLNFNVAGNGTITYITVQRVGAGQTTDFSNVYLYDGATRLTAGRSVNSSSHQVNFTGLNLAVNGVKKLTVSADISATAGASNKNAFQVVAVSANVAVSGLPVTGNEMSNSNATAGTLTVAKTGSLTNPNIGASNALLSQFRLTAANEDVKVMRVSLFFTGTVSKSNLSNFMLKDVNNAVLATASSLTSKDLVVFELSSPLTILKGDNKTFYVYGDISGLTKKDETIELYVEEKADIYGVGQQYGFGATVTNNFDSTAANHHKLTLQGGTLTTSFTGPAAGDIKKNGKDVSLFEFTMAAANNLEVKRLNASIATTAGSLSGDDALADFKVVDVDTGVIVAGPVDVPIADINSGKGYIFTDIFNINAGQTRKLKITADIPSNWDDADAIRVSLTNFTANADVKNLDNNTFLAAAEIVPSTVLSGNVQTVKAPTLEISLAGLPTSQSFVRGTTAVPFVGIGLRAIADDIMVKTLKITATSASVTDDSQIAEVQNLGLYDGDVLKSEIKSLTSVDASSSAATFTNLNYLIKKGESKVLTVKGNLSVTAVTNNVYELGVAQATTTNNTTGNDIVATDSEGNEPFYLGSFAGSGINMGSTVKITVLSGGTMTIATAPDDSESKAGVVVAGGAKQVLGKFRLTATNEALTVKKIKLLVNNDNSTNASATSTAEVSRVYLYDDAGAVLGSAGGYSIIGSGAAAGDVVIEDLNYLVPKDSTKMIVVKGDFNTIAAGATSGRSVYVHVKNSASAGDGFEATGAATTVYDNGAAGGAKGNQKVVYKTYPAVSDAATGTLLVNGSNDLIKFTVTNKSSNEQLSWNVISFNVSGASATVPLFKISGAFDPAASFTLRNLTNSVNLTIGTTATAGSATAGQYTLYLATEEVIPAGGSRDYQISGSVIAPGSNSSVSTQLVLRVDTTTASVKKGVAWRNAVGNANTGVDAVVDATDSGFVWSDNSATGHSLTTADWANGVFVDTFPGNTRSLSN